MSGRRKFLLFDKRLYKICFSGTLPGTNEEIEEILKMAPLTKTSVSEFCTKYHRILISRKPWKNRNSIAYTCSGKELNTNPSEIWLQVQPRIKDRWTDRDAQVAPDILESCSGSETDPPVERFVCERTEEKDNAREGLYRRSRANAELSELESLQSKLKIGDGRRLRKAQKDRLSRSRKGKRRLDGKIEVEMSQMTGSVITGSFTDEASEDDRNMNHNSLKKEAEKMTDMEKIKETNDLREHRNGGVEESEKELREDVIVVSDGPDSDGEHHSSDQNISDKFRLEPTSEAKSSNKSRVNQTDQVSKSVCAQLTFKIPSSTYRRKRKHEDGYTCLVPETPDNSRPSVTKTYGRNDSKTFQQSQSSVSKQLYHSMIQCSTPKAISGDIINRVAEKTQTFDKKKRFTTPNRTPNPRSTPKASSCRVADIEFSDVDSIYSEASNSARKKRLYKYRKDLYRHLTTPKRLPDRSELSHLEELLATPQYRSSAKLNRSKHHLVDLRNSREKKTGVEKTYLKEVNRLRVEVDRSKNDIKKLQDLINKSHEGEGRNGGHTREEEKEGTRENDHKMLRKDIQEVVTPEHLVVAEDNENAPVRLSPSDRRLPRKLAKVVTPTPAEFVVVFADDDEQKAKSWSERQTEGQAARLSERHLERQSEKQSERQSEIQPERQPEIERQSGRQEERQTSSVGRQISQPERQTIATNPVERRDACIERLAPPCERQPVVMTVLERHTASIGRKMTPFERQMTPFERHRTPFEKQLEPLLKTHFAGVENRGPVAILTPLNQRAPKIIASAKAFDKVQRNIHWTQSDACPRSTDREPSCYTRDRMLIGEEELGEEMKLAKFARTSTWSDEPGTHRHDDRPKRHSIFSRALQLLNFW